MVVEGFLAAVRDSVWLQVVVAGVFGGRCRKVAQDHLAAWSFPRSRFEPGEKTCDEHEAVAGEARD